LFARAGLSAEAEVRSRTVAKAASVWVASRSPKPELALVNDNVIEICVTGPTPRIDAESYARDETMDTGRETYVYEVELAQVKGYRLYKEVEAFVPPK
jgi:hypothetical protein